MKQREKGVVLILTLVVTFLLMSFAVGITIVATNSYKLTIIYERKNRLKLVAESGRERGEAAIKDYIVSGNADTVFNHPNNFVPSAAFPTPIIFHQGNVTCKVTIKNDDMTIAQNDPDHTTQNFTNYVIPSSTSALLPRKYPDRATNRNLDYILIRSEAENDDTHEKKVLDTYIDKKSITNVYFDRFFNGSLTVVPSNIAGSTPVTPAFSVGGNVTLDLAGTMFLQGDKIEIQPKLTAPDTQLKMDEGDIYVKSKNLVPSASLDPISSLGNKIKLYKSSDNITSLPEWKNTLIRGLDMLAVETPSSLNPNADTIREIDSETEEVIAGDIKYTEAIPGYPSLITYKIKQKGTNHVNFNKILDGVDLKFVNTGLYFNILDHLSNTLPPTVDYIDYYGKVYKMLIIDGDLDINENPQESIDNYIIYCTGNVKFKGNCKFFNSSIFANTITFDSTATPFKVIFAGVNTHLARTHPAINLFLSDFSQADKSAINTYLAYNLHNYTDYIKFRTIDWREY